MERAYRQLISKSLERSDLITGNWLIEGRQIPSVVPVRAKTAVELATVANLKAGGLTQHQAVIADEVSLLRDTARERLINSCLQEERCF